MLVMYNFLLRSQKIALFFLFSFFYIDAVIFYNLFFLQNQTMKIELYQTNPYRILFNFTKIKDSSQMNY